MPALRINDRAYTIGPGHIRLGGGDGVDIGIGDDARLGEQAVIDVAGGQASIRRTGSGVVKVNGVPLGAEPMPLMHGDRVEIGGREVHYADDGKSGATEFVSHAELAALAPRRAGARATTSTGGRLVSLVDGKEYTIPARGVVLGRDASADIVIPSNEVSRRHAEIVPGDRGYVLRDQSTNGVFVNGDRVDGSRVLARADVVRIATEEFRFYADVIPAAIAPSAPNAAGAQVPAALVGAVPAAAAPRQQEPHPPPTGPERASRPAPPVVRAPVTAASPASRTSSTSRVWLWIIVLAAAAAIYLLTS